MTPQQDNEAQSEAADERSPSDFSGSLVDGALKAFATAMSDLDKAVDAHMERNQTVANATEEIQRLAQNSAKLAKNLDEAETRANRLSETNGEVSRRLVGAMEMVRTVLDK